MAANDSEKSTSLIIDPARFGVSFSLKQCSGFQLDPKATLYWLVGQGWRRFRIMSYWNECEKIRGEYNFKDLDWQFDEIEKVSGRITLCLGVKQPRWPEYHWPSWTENLSADEKSEALLQFIEATVMRYKDRPSLKSYQLENEALLSNFGRNINIDRLRLRNEFSLIKKLDEDKPIAMSTSNGWGVPVRSPRPDIVGISLYTIMYKNGVFSETIQRPWLHKLRRWIIHTFLGRKTFIHELQCEPWGHTAIWKMTPEEQDRSMSFQRIRRNIGWAKQVNAYPVDLWGAEWWHWRSLKNDSSIVEEVLRRIKEI